MNICYEYNYENPNDLLDYQIGMIKNNKINNLIRFKNIKDGNYKLVYYNDSLISLKEFLKINHINLSFLTDLMEQIRDIIETNKKYFLDQDKYIFQEDKVYISLDDLKIKLIYLPLVDEIENNNRPVELLKEMIFGHLKFQNLTKKSRERIFTVLDKNMDLKQIINFIDKIEYDYENKQENKKKIKLKKIERKYIILILPVLFGILYYYNLIHFDLITSVILIMIVILSGILIFDNNKDDDFSSDSHDKKTIKMNYSENNDINLINVENGEIFKVNKEYIVIGRDSNSDLKINNDYIGRKHCVIFSKNREYIIRDLNSKNGTFLNDEKLETNKNYKLSEGDMIKIANTKLKFVR